MNKLTTEEINRIIQMAWEDRTPFDAIKFQFGLSEAEVINLMRAELKPASWRRWRKRVNGRNTKHAKMREPEIDRFKCSRQRSISFNHIAKKNSGKMR